jgi:hypothetical protein
MFELPLVLAVAVLVTNLLLVSLLVVGVDRAARRADLGRGTRRRVLGASGLVLTVWLGLAVLVTGGEPRPLAPPLLTLILLPPVLGLALYRGSATWRALVRATPPSWLIGAQAYRNVGAVFLVVWALGGLPAYFAIPAGVGDVLTGVGALVVATLVAHGWSRWRGVVLGWNALGLADLLVAFGAGSTLLAGALGTVFAAETSTAALVAFPLGTIPTFLVPASVTLHLYSLTLLFETRRPATSEDRRAAASDP